MSNKYTWASFMLYTFYTLSFFAHIFCCALPLLLASLSFFAASSVYASHWLHHPVYEWIHQYHIWILVIAAISVTISTFLAFYKKPKTRNTKVLITLSILLLIFDVSIILAEEHLFHIHH
jgi:cell division protein FtsW (lipid II flippase)